MTQLQLYEHAKKQIINTIIGLQPQLNMDIESLLMAADSAVLELRRRYDENVAAMEYERIRREQEQVNGS